MDSLVADFVAGTDHISSLLPGVSQTEFGKLRERVWSNYLLRYLDAFEEAGQPLDKVAKIAKLDLQQLRVSRHGVSRSQYLAALRCLVAINPDPLLALQVGLQHKLLDHDILGYALISAVDMKTFIEFIMRVSEWLNDRIWQDRQSSI